MKDGFVRVAAATPEIVLADCAANKEAVLTLLREAEAAGASVAVFPELCLTGYTCGDLFHDTALLRGAEEALAQLVKESAELEVLAAVGLPAALGASVYNTAAVFCKGRLLGIVPKSALPNYSEFDEARHFSPAPLHAGEPVVRGVDYAGFQNVPFGAGILFRCAGMPALCVGVEVCEDLWTAQPPSVRMALSGAVLLLNLSASDEVAGKDAYRRNLVSGQSARLFCAYAYADAGEGESTTDLVFSGHNVIAENGAVLTESTSFTTGLVTAEIDTERLLQERRRVTTWNEEAPYYPDIPFGLRFPELEPARTFETLPFVPREGPQRAERCEMILNIQAHGLASRIRHSGVKGAVIGLSGGLDSTLALLVAARAFDLLGLPRAQILTVTMPGFGTTSRTKGNAECLAELLNVSFREISIAESVRQHFTDIGQNPANHDVTYENAQARERTQILMDLANQTGALVIGTGDLSELALGWATYNGDHMSMYGVNASVPKTLVRHLVRQAAEKAEGELRAVLEDVLSTPVSPELLPPVDGKIAQKTEDLVGPYELHDFFLYYLLRFGFAPGKIYRMAQRSFVGIYDSAVILKWLKTFYRRFFSQQFKRSCMPDGPKVGSVTLSPRGDWRMPSDACAALWQRELEALEAKK